MKVQRFVVTVKHGERDGCGNPISDITEGEVRRALINAVDASSIAVEGVEEGGNA